MALTLPAFAITESEVEVQHGVMPLPVSNAVFDDSPADTGVGNHPLRLEPVQNRERLILKALPEPLLEFLDPADPLAGADCVGDPIQPAVGNTEVGIAGQDGKIKQPVDPATWVVHNLLDFKLIFCHTSPSLFTWIFSTKKPAPTFL